MQKNYSTLIIPENSKGLLFSIVSDNYLYHCWKNEQQPIFVLVKEPNLTTMIVPSQMMNFNEKELKRYLLMVTNAKEKDLNILYFDEPLWNRLMH
ncbi:MAG TPA: hypothetical protein PLJ42_01535 [Chitinophagales bacterium]|jgi:hypothetical protein|nr:hypothetical protein [Chitinophagales bacterium]MBP6154940.1 hypothetical protein [Chitinophagales bacterium]HQV76847.1 hypothetical protein [Chitinophagales bacterium]HQW78086.1 hypothetical protein [Chitinophagales bacterium]HRB68089.1 hypothetical protein [Chitinophagales bacterium]